jgi:hypothetical protein
LSFEITGHKAELEGAFVRTQAHTAADALRFAREWAEQGVTGITIVNPQGKSYDIDAFGMIVSTKEESPDASRGAKTSTGPLKLQRTSFVFGVRPLSRRFSGAGRSDRTPRLFAVPPNLR